jgi:RNA polymerase sigma-70 factor (ECF subfamily)
MPNADDQSILDILLVHRDWMRRMAAALTKDEEAAEDLLQDAHQIALRHPPEHVRAPRGWLASITRNRWRHLLRIGRRRSVAREGDVQPLPPSAPSPEAIFERMELGKAVADMVAALPEAERQVVYLKYFEGFDSVQVARRLDCPEGTVRWRLRVAIQSLRAQLDGRFGERRRWILVLIPLVPEASIGGGGPSRDRPIRPGKA